MKLSQAFRSTTFLRATLLIAAIACGTNHFAQRRPPPRTVANLTDVINAVQFSPDGRLLAIARTARDNNRVELCDTGTGKIIRTIRGFDGSVWSVSFTPDGRTLVTASGGVHQEKVAQKPRSRNGRRFTELKWWDTQTGDLKQRRELASDEVVKLVALHSPDGRLLATIENRLLLRGPAFFDLTPRAPGLYPPMRTFIEQESDLKLLDAATGEVLTKLKDGFSSQLLPFSMGMSMEGVAVEAYRAQRTSPIVFSPDGKYVAAFNPVELRVWSSSTGAEVLKLKKFKGRLTAVAFSPDGQLLAGAIGNSSYSTSEHELKSELRTWEVASGTPRQVLALNSSSVTSLSFAPNGHQLLIGGLQSREYHSYASMELADLETGSRGKLIANDEGLISSISLSPDGMNMAFQIDATTVKLVETRAWRTRFTFAGNEEASSSNASFRRFMVTVNSVPAVKFLDDDKTVVGEIENGGIKVWDARTGEARKTLAADAETGAIAAISADGRIVEVGPDETVRLWNVGGEGFKTIPTGERKVSAIALAADGRVLAIAYENTIVLLGTENLATMRTLEGVQSVAALGLSRNGHLVAAATTEGAIRIWDTETGTAKNNVASGGAITALEFAADGLLAVGLKNGTVNVWNLDRNDLAFEAKKHDGAVNAIAFSKDGKLMATGGDDRVAVIWDLQTRKSLRSLKGHDLVVSSLGFSPSGEMLAVGSGNASVVLWNVTNGKLNRVMK